LDARNGIKEQNCVESQNVPPLLFGLKGSAAFTFAPFSQQMTTRAFIGTNPAIPNKPGAHISILSVQSHDMLSKLSRDILYTSALA